MKFYRILHSHNPKIVGRVDQIKEVLYNGNIDDPKFIDKLLYKKANFTPIVPNAVLYADAKPTDLISPWGIGFSSKILVSGRFKKIIEREKKDGFDFFQSSVFHKKNEYQDYWILNTYDFDFECIDFSESEIIKIINFNEKHPMEINSYEEFKKIDDEYMVKSSPTDRVLINKVVISSNCSKNFLVLRNVKGGTRYFVSEKLKSEMENLKGIDLIPSNLDEVQAHNYRKNNFLI